MGHLACPDPHGLRMAAPTRELTLQTASVLFLALCTGQRRACLALIYLLVAAIGNNATLLSLPGLLPVPSVPTD